MSETPLHQPAQEPASEASAFTDAVQFSTLNLTRENSGNVEDQEHSFFSLRTATFLAPTPAPVAMQLTPGDVNLAASRIMKRGIALMEQPHGQPAALEEAIRCFDEAIAMRSHLPLELNSWYRYCYIASWLNRGDALTRLGGEERLRLAVTAFDSGLELLRDLPLVENPLYPRRLAIACINRGFALQNLARLEQTPDSQKLTPQQLAHAKAAADSFRKAISTLALPESAAIEDLIALQTGSRFNLAGALLDIPGLSSAIEARSAAKEALEICNPLEQHHIDIATVSLRVRHTLCRAIAHGLTDPSASTSATEGWMSEATDVVDEGMALARQWEQRGNDELRTLAQDLFRFGCRIYSTHLPHFLAEFVHENLEAMQSSASGTVPFSPAVHNAALIAVWRAWQELEHTSFKSINTPRFEQLLADLRELRITEDRLEDMRRQATQAGLVAPPSAARSPSI